MESLQQRMFAEIREGGVFHLAHAQALQYVEEAFGRNVYPSREALENLDVFAEEMPEQPTTAEEVIGLLHRYGSPATVAQIGGRYFGFVCGSAVPAGLAAKHLATYWDQNSAMYVLSPVAATLERVVEGWLRSLLGLPETTIAGFVSGTSAANLCGLAAARCRLLQNLGWDVNRDGLLGAPRIRVVAGEQAHSTVMKAIALLGFGQGAIELVEVDDQGRITSECLPELDERTLLILQAGNVNSGSFDDFAHICARAREAGAWIHIDGAFGLWAAASRPLRHLTAGMELAHSWAVDGHKTLNTPYDCGIVLCADGEALAGALHMTGSYIIRSDDRDGMIFTPEMSRRARIVELWATLKYLGTSGVDELVTSLHERAVQFATEVGVLDGFAVLNDVVFNQVVVSCDSDQATDRVLKRIQELRECWVGGSSWQGRRVIRVSVCSWATTPEDISRSVRSFAKARDLVMSEG